MNTNYTPFTPSTQNNVSRDYYNEIQNYAKKYNLYKLESNYFGVNSYFYDYTSQKLYKFNNYDKNILNALNEDLSKYECYDQHILELNNILSKDNKNPKITNVLNGLININTRSPIIETHKKYSPIL